MPIAKYLMKLKEKQLPLKHGINSTISSTSLRMSSVNTSVLLPSISPITGINAILFDVHGYAGKDWVDVFGSPLVQWAYRMNDGPSLETCPLDDRSSGTIGTLTHARWRKFGEGSFCRCIEYCCHEFPG